MRLFIKHYTTATEDDGEACSIDQMRSMFDIICDEEHIEERQEVR
jgi:hypothetical protein